jgi:hypothetical protein
VIEVHYKAEELAETFFRGLGEVMAGKVGQLYEVKTRDASGYAP